MEKYNGVAITDGKNRKNHIIPLNTIINAYHDSWNRSIPMNIGHDRTKPIGVTRMTGIYMEPGKAYVTNESLIMETPEEHNRLRQYIDAYDYDVFCEQHKSQIDELKGLLNGILSDEFKVAPIGQAVALRDKDVVKRLFPEWTNTFKDGMVNVRELQSVYSMTDTGEKGILIPGVYKKEGYLLFAHYFFRRSLSILNTTNEEFFNVFEKVKETTDVDIKVALDLDMVGLPGTETSELEYQYIRGPHFDDDLGTIPEGVTCHENEHYDNVFSNILATQFYWHIQDGKRTFECEELCDRENVCFDDGGKMMWGCRYVHSMIEPDSGIPIHLDGAIRIYDDEQIINRIDSSTDISKYGKKSKYKKLWRIDDEIPVYLWKELISTFFRENALIGEYLGGVDEKYEAIVASESNHNKEDKQPNDFSYMEFNPGDGIRVFYRYLEKFELSDQTEVKVWGKDSFLCEDGKTIKFMDAETITLLKLLKRRGVALNVPYTSIIDFNDTIFNFPTFCCKDSSVVNLVIETIKDFCLEWNKRGDDRLISFGIRKNLESESFQISFAGHIADFSVLFDCIPCLSECNHNEWINSIYSANNNFKQANNYPEIYKLLLGDMVCFKRLLVPPSIINNISMENGVMNVILKLNRDEISNYLEHKIIVAPYFRIKHAVCKKCGNDYLQCNCVKYIDEGVVNEVTEMDMFGLTWTNRNAYFPMGKLSFDSI